MSNQFLKVSSSIPKNVKLVVVTKSKKIDDIFSIVRLGQRFFGENRVQEAYKKWFHIKEFNPDIQLHMVGHLQTNKVKQALQIFDVIESLDRVSLAKELAKNIKINKKPVKIFVEINIANEINKSGIAVDIADQFINYCINELSLPIVGIMIIPPEFLDPIPFFKLAKEIQKRNNLPELSMGMSNDYSQAINCGATEVRVGRKIFE